MNDDQPRSTPPETSPDRQPTPGSYAGSDPFEDRGDEHMDRASARAARRAERARWRAERRKFGGPWVGGAILILVGLILLAQNFGISTLNNWWALFILIPAVGSLATAWGIYQANDSHLTPAARSALISGIVLTAITAAFLFNLNWGLLWPLLLILAGIAALINATLD
jgi:hypothetical protein